MWSVRARLRARGGGGGGARRRRVLFFVDAKTTQQRGSTAAWPLNLPEIRLEAVFFARDTSPLPHRAAASHSLPLPSFLSLPIMPLAADLGRVVALAFFASHVPVTLFVDSQVGERDEKG